TLTLTVTGENDAPVIQSGGGGAAAAYFVRSQDTAVTQVVATDVDYGDVVSYQITGGADAGRFAGNAGTGALSFAAKSNPVNKPFQVTVQASDGHGGLDSQSITVTVTADKIVGTNAADTFVFHAKFGAAEIVSFDVAHDFLQFDKGMFSADTA